MASKSKHTNDPSALTRRVAVIEWRGRGEREWEVYRAYFAPLPTETDLILGCRDLSETHTGNEFRYRAATLTFDDDGRKATIY